MFKSNMIVMGEIAPPRFGNILKAMKAGGVVAAFAGGLPRDILAGKPVKDADLFVSDEMGARSVLMGLGYTAFCRTVGGLDCDDSDSEFVTSVWQFSNPNEIDLLPIEVISVRFSGSDWDFVKYLFDSFDLSLSQAAITGESGDIEVSPMFLKDFQNRQCSVLMTGERTEKRIVRFKAKFPEYTVSREPGRDPAPF